MLDIVLFIIKKSRSDNKIQRIETIHLTLFFSLDWMTNRFTERQCKINLYSIDLTTYLLAQLKPGVSPFLSCFFLSLKSFNFFHNCANVYSPAWNNLGEVRLVSWRFGTEGVSEIPYYPPSRRDYSVYHIPYIVSLYLCGGGIVVKTVTSMQANKCL